jgi:hypothetical protein
MVHAKSKALDRINFAAEVWCGGCWGKAFIISVSLALAVQNSALKIANVLLQTKDWRGACGNSATKEARPWVQENYTLLVQ